MAFKLKLPPVFDVSSHVDPAHLPIAECPVKPYAMIARASVATYPRGYPYATFDVVEDSSFAEWYRQSREMNTRFGAYPYLLQGKMEKQIDTFLSACRKAGVLSGAGKWQAELPPFADVEIEPPNPLPERKRPKNYVVPYKGARWAGEVKQWLDAVEQVTGVVPGIYTDLYKWNELLTDYKALPWSSRYPFWVKYYPFSQYIDNIDSLPTAAIPKGVSESQVALWQYSDKGRANEHYYSDLNLVTKAGMGRWDHALPHEAETPDDLPDGSDDLHRISYNNGVAAGVQAAQAAMNEAVEGLKK